MGSIKKAGQSDYAQTVPQGPLGASSRAMQTLRAALDLRSAISAEKNHFTRGGNLLAPSGFTKAVVAGNGSSDAVSVASRTT